MLCGRGCEVGCTCVVGPDTAAQNKEMIGVQSNLGLPVPPSGPSLACTVGKA
jgi:hypothetical protein